MGAVFGNIGSACAVHWPSGGPKRPVFRIAQREKLSPNCRQVSWQVMILGREVSFDLVGP